MLNLVLELAIDYAVGMGSGGVTWLGLDAPLPELPADLGEWVEYRIGAGHLSGEELPDELLPDDALPGDDELPDWDFDLDPFGPAGSGTAGSTRPDPDGLAGRLGELRVLAAQAEAGFGADDPVQALIVIEKHKAWLDGLTQLALSAVADADPSAETDLWCREEIAAALRWSPVTTGIKIARAQRLCQGLPATLACLLDGVISLSHASAVAEASYPLRGQLLAAFEARVLPRAGTQTLSALKRSLRRAVLALDPAAAQQRHQQALKDRAVSIGDGEDGMSTLTAQLSAADAHAIDLLLDAAADLQLTADRAHAADRAEEAQAGAESDSGAGTEAGAETDTLRTKQQIRADLLVDLILGGLDPDRLPQHHGHRPVINIHVGLSTLTGQDDNGAWLEGYGPVTADTARDLAADPTGTWRRLITDPATQQLLDYDITNYRPPTAIIDHIIITQPTCTAPGCARTAQRCDLDHTQPHSSGGLSTTHNLQPLCRRHHRMKHHAHWQPNTHTDGSTHWISPTGRTYLTHPEPRLTPTGPTTPTEPPGRKPEPPPPF